MKSGMIKVLNDNVITVTDGMLCVRRPQLMKWVIPRLEIAYSVLLMIMDRTPHDKTPTDNEFVFAMAKSGFARCFCVSCASGFYLPRQSSLTVQMKHFICGRGLDTLHRQSWWFAGPVF